MDREKFEEWLEKYPKVEDVYYFTKGIIPKLDYFFARRYPMTKEHREMGFKRKHRPLKRYDSFEARSVLPWITYPVLVRFRRNPYAMGHPAEFNDEEEWHAVLDKIIHSFELLIRDDHEFDFEKAEELLVHYNTIQEGLDLYAKYFLSLWD